MSDTSEKEVDVQEAYELASGTLLEWKTLLESPGWKRLKAIAEGQVTARIEANGRTRCNGFDAIFEQEFSKGEVSGIELFLRIPEVEIEQYSEEVNHLLEVINDIPE